MKFYNVIHFALFRVYLVNGNNKNFKGVCMKKIMFAALSTLVLSQPTFAHNRTIVCKDLTGLQEILRFNSLQGRGEVSTSTFDLQVEILGDDVRVMKLTDHANAAVLHVVRSEEILNGSLAVQASETLRAVSGTRRGFADLTIGKAKVTSYERKGESRMELKLHDINILCETIR